MIQSGRWVGYHSEVTEFLGVEVMVEAAGLLDSEEGVFRGGAPCFSMIKPKKPYPGILYRYTFFLLKPPPFIDAYDGIYGSSDIEHISVRWLGLSASVSLVSRFRLLLSAVTISLSAFHRYTHS